MVTTFAERESELGLKKFLDSPRGTMFIADDSQVVDQDGFLVRPLVRRLDGFITPALVDVYAEMVEASDRWVARHPDLDRFVRVMPITEVGEDFITRMHFSVTSTSAFAREEEDDRPEIPVQVQEMREAFRTAKGKFTDAKSKIIERVLARNLMEPSSLTFFDDQDAAFFVMEPHIREADINEFSELER
jgi:hypothetical protein